MPASISNEANALLISLLNRNPLKRLGSGPNDAEDIKSHPFFTGIDWDKVEKREYSMPKPVIQDIKYQEFRASIFAENQEEVNQNIPGWSFVNPNHKSDPSP